MLELQHTDLSRRVQVEFAKAAPAIAHLSVKSHPPCGCPLHHGRGETLVVTWRGQTEDAALIGAAFTRLVNAEVITMDIQVVLRPLGELRDVSA